MRRNQANGDRRQCGIEPDQQRGGGARDGSISRRAFNRRLLLAGAASLAGSAAARWFGGLPPAFAQQGFKPKANFTFAQLRYRGADWDVHPRAHSALMEEVRRRTSVEAANVRKTLEVLDPQLFSYPLLYMSGRQEFQPYSDEEIAVLRRFLSFGGLLFIDDAAGFNRVGFDKSVRQMIARIFPNRPLQRLLSDHTIFRSYYLVRRVGGRHLVKPYLEGVNLDDRSPIVYCHNDLGGAWERDYLGNWLYPCVPGGEAQRLDAFKLGVNMVLYGLTVNYKRDKIHLPFLRKRMG